MRSLIKFFESISAISGGGAPQPCGFTGHEHIRQFNLINMNARLYDPRIGRFLSPDNYITDPENPQSYNRYTYALNNPLSYVDPSGNVVLGIFGNGGQTVAALARMTILSFINSLTPFDVSSQNEDGSNVDIFALVSSSFSGDDRSFQLLSWRKDYLEKQQKVMGLLKEAGMNITHPDGAKLPGKLEFSPETVVTHNYIQLAIMQINYAKALAKFEATFPNYSVPAFTRVIAKDGRLLASERGEKYYAGLSITSVSKNDIYLDDYMLLNGISRSGFGFDAGEIYYREFTIIEALTHEIGHYYGNYFEFGFNCYVWNPLAKENYSIEFTNILRRFYDMKLERHHKLK